MLTVVNTVVSGTGNFKSDVSRPAREESVMDFVFVGLIVGFFALSAGLIHLCAKLMGHGGRS